MNVDSVALPDHVPAHLVRDYPLLFGRVSDENPHETMIPKIHEGPDVFYALNAYPGDQPAWIVRRTEDLRKVYFDTENFTNAVPGPFAALAGEDWRLVPFEWDPPEHTLYRAFVNPLFTPKAMSKLETRIRGYAREYIEAFKPNGSCEFIQDFAFEFPIKIFLELAGLPLELTSQFLEWETGMLHASDPNVIAASTRSVVQYLRGEIAARKVNPKDDLLSYGVTAKIDGRELTDDELLGFAFNLYIGGLDTVSTNMSFQFKHLASNPDHQAMLRENPAMIPNAIDECMRAYASVTTFRVCVKETEIRGVKIMPGDKIAMSTSISGRDPNEYDRPNEVILDRKPRHVSWGYGPHMCVGMHLAKREMRIAMEEFLAIIPEFQIAPGAKLRYHLGGMIQPETVPLVWKV